MHCPSHDRPDTECCSVQNLQWTDPNCEPLAPLLTSGSRSSRTCSSCFSSSSESLLSISSSLIFLYFSSSFRKGRDMAPAALLSCFPSSFQPCRTTELLAVSLPVNNEALWASRFSCCSPEEPACWEPHLQFIKENKAARCSGSAVGVGWAEAVQPYPRDGKGPDGTWEPHRCSGRDTLWDLCKKKHWELIPSTEINLFSFMCSETAVSAVLLARGVKRIRGKPQP